MNTNICIAAKLLMERKLHIAFAESATAGRLTAEFAKPKNAGTYLKGPVVCYNAKAKETLLGVSERIIEECTPEPEEVTKAITQRLAKVIKAEYILV